MIGSQVTAARDEGCRHLMVCAPGQGCRGPRCLCSHAQHPDRACPVRACGCQSNRPAETHG